MSMGIDTMHAVYSMPTYVEQTQDNTLFAKAFFKLFDRAF
jgi:hypothetical protein